MSQDSFGLRSGGGSFGGGGSSMDYDWGGGGGGGQSSFQDSPGNRWESKPRALVYLISATNCVPN